MYKKFVCLIPSIPLVSFIIPVYNRADVVGETLDSVVAQTYKNWECLVVDDGSTDNSVRAIQDHASRDQRFTILNNRNAKGAPGARNTGVEMSNGAYIIFLDSDDLLSPTCLENRVQKFHSHPGFDFLVFSTVEFKERPDDTNILLNVSTKGDIIERFLNLDVPWLTTGPIWKRECLLKIGEWNEGLVSWQDWEFHIRALFMGCTFKYFSLVDNYVRRDVPLVSIGTESFSKKHMKSYLALFGQLKVLMSGHPAYIQRLNGLGYWVAEQAMANAYEDVAIEALRFIKDSLTKKQWLKAMANFKLNKAINISNMLLPDYGTMRKVYYTP